MTRVHRIFATSVLLTMLIAPVAMAHGVAHRDGDDEDAAATVAGPHNWHELWRTWGWEPGSIIGLALSGGLYATGLRRMWKSSGIGHGVARWEAACFASGWFALFVALVSPLHPWGAVLFSAHMTQHEILMLVAAPLMVLGTPMVVFLRALPSSWAQSLARFGNSSPWRSFWTAISTPFAAFVIHGAILWLWHVPALFQATLTSEWVHALQHSSFLFSALLFWWAVVHVKDRVMGYGAAILYMFTTALHSGILGALITFAAGVWYPAYAKTTPWWGLTPMEDQQLGGLIMWIPAGIVYIIAGLALVAGWMRESERRVQLREVPAVARRAEVAT